MANCHLARRVVATVLALAMWLPAATAEADSRTSFLISRLHADDFRVRTNAALALGATNDDDAVQPLCGAVSDGNEVVRQAAAAALKRLGKSAALPCLKARLSVEGNADVKLQLTRAIGALESGGGGGGPPANVANAKFYVSVSITSNSTGHDGGKSSGQSRASSGRSAGIESRPRPSRPPRRGASSPAATSRATTSP